MSDRGDTKMIFDQPKGYKYWIHMEQDVKISDDAPDWAKKEFAEFWKQAEKYVVKIEEEK